MALGEELLSRAFESILINIGQIKNSPHKSLYLLFLFLSVPSCFSFISLSFFLPSVSFIPSFSLYYFTVNLPLILCVLLCSFFLSIYHFSFFFSSTTIIVCRAEEEKQPHSTCSKSRILEGKRQINEDWGTFSSLQPIIK